MEDEIFKKMEEQSVMVCKLNDLRDKLIKIRNKYLIKNEHTWLAKSNSKIISIYNIEDSQKKYIGLLLKGESQLQGRSFCLDKPVTMAAQCLINCDRQEDLEDLQKD